MMDGHYLWQRVVKDDGRTTVRSRSGFSRFSVHAGQVLDQMLQLDAAFNAGVWQTEHVVEVVLVIPGGAGGG